MVSIKDVAKLAGVSTSTVSRVMNNNTPVSEEKMKRVLKAIKHTNFVPNEIARCLYKKSSKLIGVIVPNLQNLFFLEMVRAIEDRVYKRGYKLILCNSNDNITKEIDNIRFLKTMNAEGVILLTSAGNTDKYISDFDMPFIVLDRDINNTNKIINIECNHYKGVTLATKHLIKCGCKSIVHLSGSKHLSSAKKRLTAYLDVCKSYNVLPKVIAIGFNPSININIFDKISSIHSNVDGIICGNDMVAIKLCKELNDKSINVPNQIQIIGFDDIEFCKMVSPSITTIKQPLAEMGKYSVDTLLDFIEGIIHSKNKSKIFDIELVIRDTTKNNFIRR